MIDINDPIAAASWYAEEVQKIQAVADAAVDKAKKEVEKQLKLYVGMFSVAFAIAGGLVAFAGSLEYKDAVDRAVSSVKGTFTADVRQKVVNDSASQLDPQVQTLVTQRAEKEVNAEIDHRLNGYIQKDTDYSILNMTTGFYLDVNGGAANPGQPVDVVKTKSQSWRVVDR